jgi:hypothetical protein
MNFSRSREKISGKKVLQFTESKLKRKLEKIKEKIGLRLQDILKF